MLMKAAIHNHHGYIIYNCIHQISFLTKLAGIGPHIGKNALSSRIGFLMMWSRWKHVPHAVRCGKSQLRLLHLWGVLVQTPDRFNVADPWQTQVNRAGGGGNARGEMSYDWGGNGPGGEDRGGGKCPGGKSWSPCITRNTYIQLGL